METVNIEKMTYGIDALAHINGKVAFIPYGAPKDIAEINIVETKTDYFRAEISKLLEPSALRQNSPCPHFPECGACHWLHLNPEIQRGEKEAQLQYLLKPLSAGVVYPIEALPETGYRNKMDLKIQVRESGELLLGNYRYRSHDVVDMHHCLVQCEPNMKLYFSLYEFISNRMKLDLKKSIEQIVARTLKTQQHAMVYLKSDPSEEMLDLWRSFFDQTDSLARLELIRGTSSFLTLMREKEPFQFMKRTWTVSPMSFFQNNLEGTEAIFFTLLSIYGNSSHKGKLLDFYCGVGLQTMLLENKFDEVVAVESQPESFQDALKNQKNRRPSQIRFLNRKVESIFGTHLVKGVISALHVNPPRTGLSPRVTRGLTGIKPRIITYLSCNPITFKRDSQALVSMGYRLEKVFSFDLFPGTFHLEILGYFTRN
ncbi:class I SAM-dependent RNA methyltransferase [bacterium]|nr:class I SAM-dependent RNA methyltransferase [bacterium]